MTALAQPAQEHLGTGCIGDGWDYKEDDPGVSEQISALVLSNSRKCGVDVSAIVYVRVRAW